MIRAAEKLNLLDFSKTLNVQNKETKILSLDVPSSKRYQLDSQRYAKMRLTGKTSATVSPAAGADFTVVLDAVPVIKDTLTKCLFARCYKSGTYFAVTVKSVDAKTKTVTLTNTSGSPLNAVTVDVYYLPSEGSFKIVYEAPVGSSTEKKAFYNGSIGDVNSKDHGENTGIALTSVILFDDYYLDVYVNTPALIDLNNPLAFVEIPFVEYDHADFVELAAKYGYTPEIMAKLQRERM